MWHAIAASVLSLVYFGNIISRRLSARPLARIAQIRPLSARCVTPRGTARSRGGGGAERERQKKEKVERRRLPEARAPLKELCGRRRGGSPGGGAPSGVAPESVHDASGRQSLKEEGGD